MKRSHCILVYVITTKGDVVRSHCILVYVITTKGDVVRSHCILVYVITTKGDVMRRSDCTKRGRWMTWYQAPSEGGRMTLYQVLSDMSDIQYDIGSGDIFSTSS